MTPSPAIELGDDQDVTVIGSVVPMTGLDCQRREFFWAWHRFVEYSKAHLCKGRKAIAFIDTDCVFTSPQRNRACYRAQGEWLFFLDTDHLFPPDLLVRMLESQEAIAKEHGACDVLTGLYFRRHPPFEPLIYTYAPETKDWDPILEFPWDEPFRVDGCGAGCLLIQSRVWWEIVVELNVGPFDWLGQLRLEKGETVDSSGSEDLPFCLRCREIGAGIWCDPRIQCRHLMMISVGAEHFKSTQQQLLDDLRRNGPLARARRGNVL